MEVRNDESQNKKLLRNLLIAALSSFSVIAVILIFSKSGNLIKSIKNFPPVEILFEFSLFSLIFVIDSLRTLVLSHFLSEKAQWNVALRNSILGYFFTYITPFSAGGQPYQIWHLSKWGMSAENSSAIILTRWSNMLIFLSFSSLLLMNKYLPYIQVGIPLLNKMIWLVILLSVAFSLGMVFFFLVPTVGKKLIHKLREMKVIKWSLKLFKKDSDEVFNVLLKKMDNFYDAMKLIWTKKPWLVIFDGSMGVLDLLVLYYILYRAIIVSSQTSLAPFHLSFWNLSAIFILLSFVIYYVPTPGSSGGVEGGFYAVLSIYGSKSAVMTGVLMWRLTTYYLPIVVGFIVMIYEIRQKPKSASS
jgi:uncharacterized protein (TIRG00374 family)